MRLSHLALGLASSLAIFSACSDQIASPDVQTGSAAVLSSMSSSSSKVDVGRELFFDMGLSANGNQSCAACHDPKFGFTGPKVAVNKSGGVYAGSFRQRSGNRKPPSAAYAAFAPILHFDAAEGLWIGGNFWDGRATGEALGNPAADQAVGPFLNPVEQALPDRSCVIYMIREGKYADLWYSAWGEAIADVSFPNDMMQECRRSSDDFDVDFSDADDAILDEAYGQVGLSIAEYEGSAEVSAFSSRYDAWKAGADVLTEQEEWGFELFTGEKAMCSACHPADLSNPMDLFTDFSFDNLGGPANPENPVYQLDPGFVDLGLGGFLGDPAEYGKQKVPTLRNVDKKPATPVTKSFSHNGYFKSLEQIVHFYNTRDVKPTCPGPYTADQAMAAGCWPAPEVAANVNSDELGNLGLTPEEEAAIVAFMRTLADE